MSGKHRSPDGFSTGEFRIVAGARPKLYFERGRHAAPARLDRFRTVIVVAALNVATLTTGSQAWCAAGIAHHAARSGDAGTAANTARRGVIWAPAPSSYRTLRTAR